MIDYVGHDCEAPMGLLVHQEDGKPVRFPIVDSGITLRQRKQGPVSLTQSAQATLPIEGFGRGNWLDSIAAFSEGGQIQVADVIARRFNENGEAIGPYSTLFRGYIGAVGSKPGPNRAAIRIHDPMKFLSSIEAGVRFNSATVRDVLRYVRDRFLNEQPIFDSLQLAGDGLDQPAVRSDALAQSGIASTGEPVNVPQGNTRPRGFSTNRDVLSDITNWLTKVTDTRIWFGVRDGNLSLIAARDPSATFDGTEGADLQIIKNSVLHESRPLTSLRLKGKAATTLDLDDRDLEVFEDEYPQVTATHEGLADRFGGQLVKTGTSRATTIDSLEEEARSRLKSLLDDVSGGEMVVALSPEVRCYDRVRAVPTCASQTAADLEPLEYEVERVVHRMKPESDNIPNSTLHVSMDVNVDDISITSSSILDAQTGEEPTDESAVDSYTWTVGTGGS